MGRGFSEELFVTDQGLAVSHAMRVEAAIEPIRWLYLAVSASNR
jgi:hypothetical protein